MKIFQLIDLIIKLFKLNKWSKVVLLFLVPTFLLGQNQAFWLGKRQSAGGDPYYANVSLLLHMDGANASTTFTDNSINNFTVTPFGNAKISTAQSKFGGASAVFDGSGDWLSVSSSQNLELGSIDFTIEALVYFTSIAAVNGNVVVSKGAAGSVGSDFYSLQAMPSGVINFYFTSGLPLIVGSTLSANTWYHIAVTRSGNSFTMYVNGTSVGSATSSATLSSGGPCIVGSQSYSPGASDRSITGYIDDLRITKGVARYTSNFTPPTAPFPNN